MARSTTELEARLDTLGLAPTDFVRAEDVATIISSLDESSVTATGSSTARTLADWMADQSSFAGFGGDPDTADNADNADNADAVTAAEARGKTFVPAGVYETTVGPTVLNGPFWGVGQIADSAGNNRAPFFTTVKSAPSPVGTHTSIDTAFNGDLSGVQFPIEHRITGSTTLGQPTSGYSYTPEAYPIYAYLYNSSGYNHETDGNDGRTAAVLFRGKVYQAGQGDAVVFNASGFVTGAKAGATSFLANPAAVLFNGDLTAGAGGVYLNPGEFALNDAGYDVSGIGWVVKLTRSAASSSLNTYWAGFRAQSLGAVAVDDAFFAIGLYDRGMTLVMGEYSDGAAVVLGQDQRIYWDSAFSGSNTYRVTGLGAVSTYFDGTTLVTTSPITIQPGSSVTPTSNGDVVFELTANTTLTFKAKGSDGTVRSGTVTLS